EDFAAALGYEVPGMDEHISAFEVEGLKQMIGKVVKHYAFKVVATTLRKAKTATLNDWGAICYCDEKFYKAKNRENLEIFDRVGGGDSFASGLIYGFLSGQEPQWSVECGAAHGALAMTTPGDTSMVTFPEVMQVMKGVGARIAGRGVCEGGIPIVEITMTVPGAVEVIRELAKSAGAEILIGAGKVLNAEMARRCLDAGAQFLVSPGLNLQVVQLAAAEGKLMMAGALTPTEVITAWEAGSDFVKVFPCGQVGGAEYIKALKGPLPQVQL